MWPSGPTCQNISKTGQCIQDQNNPSCSGTLDFTGVSMVPLHHSMCAPVAYLLIQTEKRKLFECRPKTKHNTIPRLVPCPPQAKHLLTVRRQAKTSETKNSLSCDGTLSVTWFYHKNHGFSLLFHVALEAYPHGRPWFIETKTYSM